MLLNLIMNFRGTVREIYWSNIWHDTIRGIPWLENMPSISPGRWAVGYNYLYVMTRILNDKNPKSVLELGLGASSTLISQYFNYIEKNMMDTQSPSQYNYLIAEHNDDWINFYTLSHPLPSNCIIAKQNMIKKIYKGTQYNAYENLAKDIKGKKFSVISIDAPIGDRKYKYNRRDILELIPDVLEESFVILIDDAQRWGEKNTIKNIKRILQGKNIPYCTSIYSGETNCCVIASADNAFLCSL